MAAYQFFDSVDGETVVTIGHVNVNVALKLMYRNLIW